MYLNIWSWACSFFIGTWISRASIFKKTGVKLEWLIDIDMLMMVKKEIRSSQKLKERN